MGIVYQFGQTKLNRQEQEYVDKRMRKIQRLLARSKDEEKKINLEISQDKRSFWMVSITAQIPKKIFRVKKSGNELLEVVDIAEGALSEQIRRNNEKVKNLKRKRRVKK